MCLYIHMIEYVDNVVIGGGIYGLHVATEIMRSFPDRNTLVLERESEFFSRASSKNHGRLHHGYQYPTSDPTAIQCIGNYNKFETEYRECIAPSSIAEYALHKQSIVDTDEYIRFCQRVGLRADRIRVDNHIYGEDISSVFSVDETTFSLNILRKLIVDKFEGMHGSLVHFETDVKEVAPLRDKISIQTSGDMIVADNVFNCGYFGIDKLHTASSLPLLNTDSDDTILFKAKMPEGLKGLSFTTIYGDFSTAVVSEDGDASHVLAHVTHSKRSRSSDNSGKLTISDEEVEERFARMVESAIGYLPCFREAELCGFTIEAKTQYGNSRSDGERRVITLKDWGGLKGYNVILGGKMNNFYDASAFALSTMS